MEWVSPDHGVNVMATVGLQICDVVDCLPRKTEPAGNRQEGVLLIEDSEEAMLLVRYALQEYGNGIYRLEWADGLTAGLHRLGKGGIDLVILDLGLPESSGAASHASIREAVPELPVLVLTADAREQTELKVTSKGVEDYLMKDEVSGALLVEAIRVALYSNRRWREQKSLAYKQSPRFLWAQEQCQALSTLAIRMLKLNRIESAIACAKALAAIVDSYSQAENAMIAGRAELFVSMERLARAAAAQGLKESARRFRALIAPSSRADAAERDEFTALMRRRIEELDRDSMQKDLVDTARDESTDLAQVFRQILESVPSLG